ncbi:methyltransferase domain-containing protein [Candidatus Woesearchaeota archaeon]|nr:methyltransferase domain-containing protein [Candidatus Woesearchaeota archaeon]HIH38246.1 methyltransferase domain-containing protein [Candidatus Woesearchaeota archaeon]HIH49093.1 methyltransferase domain-containing protein [Candidatus Woesearchaeota archaeon]HIJ04168.1 methyltransferase domain-containing protein [Candidatus Woesearchaeota archaeon]
MEGMIITHPGMEEVAAQEIKEIIGAEAVAGKSMCMLSADTEQLFSLAYAGQSFLRVLKLYRSFTITALEDIKKELSNVSPLVFPSEGMICIQTIRVGSHPFQSIDATETALSCFRETLQGRISLKNYQHLVMLIINDDQCYFGLDIAGFDLSKRDYKVFLHPSSLRGTLGYGIVRMSGYVPGKVLVDPFCGSGIIPIEAAFFCSRLPVCMYRKKDFLMKEEMQNVFAARDKKAKTCGNISGFDRQLRHVSAAKKNAAIAGIKDISFSRVDIEDLDLRFDKGSVDYIVTQPPEPSRIHEEKIIAKVYRDFFRNGAFVLKKKGILCVCVRKKEPIEMVAGEYFTKLGEQVIGVGKDCWMVLRFEKKP